MSRRILSNSRSWNWPLRPGTSCGWEGTEPDSSSCPGTLGWPLLWGSSTPACDDTEALDSLPVIGLLKRPPGNVSSEECVLVEGGCMTIILASELPGSLSGVVGFCRIGTAWPTTVKSTLEEIRSLKHSLFALALSVEPTEVMESFSVRTESALFFLEALVLHLRLLRFPFLFLFFPFSCVNEFSCVNVFSCANEQSLSFVLVQEEHQLPILQLLRSLQLCKGEKTITFYWITNKIKLTWKLERVSARALISIF